LPFKLNPRTRKEKGKKSERGEKNKIKEINISRGGNRAGRVGFGSGRVQVERVGLIYTLYFFRCLIDFD
jgi:hypothetical protein